MATARRLADRVGKTFAQLRSEICRQFVANGQVLAFEEFPPEGEYQRVDANHCCIIPRRCFNSFFSALPTFPCACGVCLSGSSASLDSSKEARTFREARKKVAHIEDTFRTVAVELKCVILFFFWIFTAVFRLLCGTKLNWFFCFLDLILHFSDGQSASSWRQC